MKNFFLLIIISAALFSCDKDKTYDKEKAVSAFIAIDPVRIDEALANVEIKIPPQENIDFSSANPALQNSKIENFKFDFTFSEKGFFKKYQEIKLQSSSKFLALYLGDEVDNFVYHPVIFDNKAFIVKTSGMVYAIDLATEKTLWKKSVFAKSFIKNYKTAKISYANGNLFVINGSNQVAALSAETGEVLWVKDLLAIAISTPVSDGKNVFVLTDTNKLYALNNATGELVWMHSGVLKNTAIFGAATPVIYGDFLVVSYSSGEIYALNKNTGESLWTQDLNLNKATSSDFYLNDIDATPLVADNMVYAIGNGGAIAAFDVVSGNYLWRKKIAGITDFWGAGEFLFVINNDNKLIALSKKTGGIKWISQLPDYKKKGKAQTKFIYSGIVMAGDRLMISRSDGEFIIASPENGKIEKTYNIGRRILHAPIIVDGKIYLNSIGGWTNSLIELK